MWRETLKNILDQRKESWLWSKESKNIIFGMLKMYRDYPKIIEKLFLHKKLPFQAEVLDILWLGDDIKDLLAKYLESRDFTEDNELFKELNRVFESKYDILSRVYKYDDVRKCIKLIYWNAEEFTEKVNLSNTKNGHYITELESVKEWNDSKFFYNRSVKSFWSKWSIWIDILGERFVFVFWDTKTPEIEIKKIRSLFENLDLRNRIHSKLKSIREKYKDRLTSLYNVKYINEVMLTKASSIIFIDVNEMKKINDICWYVPANKILIEISNILLESVKHWDKVCRFWWDEFVIFVKQNDEDIILSMKNRIEANIERRNQDNELNIKLSIWYSMYDEAKDFETRLEEAWKDMKKNKESDWQTYRVVSDTMEFSKEDQSKTAVNILWILDPNDRQKVVQETCVIAKAWNCSWWWCSTKKEEA